MSPDPRPFLRSVYSPVVSRRPCGFELLAPGCGFVGVVGGLVELDEPIEGFRQADLALCRHRLLALFHPFVAGQQERFGLDEVLLAQQCPAEQRLGVERRPGVGLRLLADGQALAEERLGLGKGFGLEQRRLTAANCWASCGLSLGSVFRASVTISKIKLGSLAFSPAFM